MYLQKILMLCFMHSRVRCLNRKMHFLQLDEELLIICTTAWFSHQMITCLLASSFAQIATAMQDASNSATSMLQLDDLMKSFGHFWLNQNVLSLFSVCTFLVYSPPKPSDLFRDALVSRFIASATNCLAKSTNGHDTFCVLARNSCHMEQSALSSLSTQTWWCCFSDLYLAYILRVKTLPSTMALHKKFSKLVSCWRSTTLTFFAFSTRSKASTALSLLASGMVTICKIVLIMIPRNIISCVAHTVLSWDTGKLISSQMLRNMVTCQLQFFAKKSAKKKSPRYQSSSWPVLCLCVVSCCWISGISGKIYNLESYWK